MARKLLQLGLAWTLVLGCWGGVLAAAVCPHRGCETKAAAPVEDAAQVGHAADASHAPAAHEDHAAHAAGHQGHTAEQGHTTEQGHAAEPPARPQPTSESVGLKGAVSGPRGPFCSHCVRRDDAPPSPRLEWQPNPFSQHGKEVAPRAAGLIPAPAAGFVRDITPAQHAPPGRSGRHLLLSVFRI